MQPTELPEWLRTSQRLQPGESPLVTTRPSPRLLWGELIQAATIIGLTLVLTQLFAFRGIDPDRAFGGDPLQALLGLGAVGAELVYLVPRVAVAAIHVFFTEYTLTTDRIYARTEFFSTDLKIVPYEKVTQVRLRRNLFERLLGVTELSVQAYGAYQGRVRMRGLRDPVPLFQTTRERIRVHNTADAIVRSD